MIDSNIDAQNLPPHSHEAEVTEDGFVKRFSSPDDFTEGLDEEE